MESIMRIIPFTELAEKQNIQISKIFAINQIWRTMNYSYLMTQPRRQSAFVWFCNIDGEYVTERGTELSVPRGSLIYIPEGAKYRFSTSAPTDDFPKDGRGERADTVLIELCLGDGKPFALSEDIELLFPIDEDGPIARIIKRMVEEYALPSTSYLKLSRDIFELLALVSAKLEKGNLNRHGFHTIEAGIKYLQKDGKQELSIEEIAKMCFVTPAYFRRLFREYTGMSPNEYRIKRKIERAKDMMEKTEISISEISELLGYADPSYFWHRFKKEVGMSPSEYQKFIEFNSKKGFIE